MKPKIKIARTALVIFVLFGLFMAIDPAFNNKVYYYPLISAVLFPVSYFAIFSIVYYIGEIVFLFEYAWIFHFIQFAVYGWIYAHFWILDRPKKGAISVIVTHFVVMIIYLSWGLLFAH